jgi:hypothetical protein
VPARPGCHERHLAGGKDGVAGRESHMFAEARRQPQPAVERHDEGERLGPLFGFSTDEPIGEQGSRRGNSSTGIWLHIAQLSRTYIAVYPRLRHARTIST